MISLIRPSAIGFPRNALAQFPTYIVHGLDFPPKLYSAALVPPARVSKVKHAVFAHVRRILDMRFQRI